MRLGRPLAPLLPDLGLSLLLAIWWTAEAGPLSALGAASLVLCTLPLGWRRVAPLGALVLVASGLVAGAAEAAPAEPLAQLVAVLVAPCSAAVHATTLERAVAGGAVAVLAGVLSGVLIGDDVIFLTLLVLAAWGAGFAVRRLHGRSTQLEDRAARLDQQARLAAAEERARIARELHDVVSHSVSLMVVQAGAAEQVLRSDPEQAARALQGLQATGRAAVDDLRRMLGLLRDAEGGGHPLAPQPGLRALPSLVAGFRDSGLEVSLAPMDALPSLPAGVDLAVYRILQEGLTNAAKHAPGRPTAVHVGLTGGRLALEVRTRGAQPAGGDGTGHGLVGMRERVDLYGGELDAGREGRDWVVRASIPVPV